MSVYHVKHADSESEVKASQPESITTLVKQHLDKLAAYTECYIVKFDLGYSVKQLVRWTVPDLVNMLEYSTVVHSTRQKALEYTDAIKILIARAFEAKIRACHEKGSLKYNQDVVTNTQDPLFKDKFFVYWNINHVVGTPIFNSRQDAQDFISLLNTICVDKKEAATYELLRLVSKFINGSDDTIMLNFSMEKAKYL